MTGDDSVLWTAGAKRAIAGAGHLAAADRASVVSPKHLLWAILMEESRASERLLASGLTRMAAGLPEEWLEQDLSAVAAVEPPLPQSPVLRDVLRGAIIGRGVEHATEQLLDALLSTETEVLPLLMKFGLAKMDATAGGNPDGETMTEPIAVKFRLQEHHVTSSDELGTYQLIDAAANRAREGLRAWEDFTRFVPNDRFLSRELKSLRHELSNTMSIIPQQQLLASRETQRDVGTSVSLATERVRADAVAVALAASKRVQEALRSLEEYLKVVSPAAAERAEQIRYATYTLEKATFRNTATQQPWQEHPLYLLVTESLTPQGVGPLLRATLAAGVRLYQLREKNWSDRRLLDHARQMESLIHEHDGLLIVNDRPDIALLVNADGVHLGQDDLSVYEARRILGPNRLIGVSTHTVSQAEQAVRDGADYLGVGPTFATQTKSFEEYAGLDFVREMAQHISLPWYAIGGIDSQTLPLALEAGARRVAVSSAICSAESPKEAAEELLRLLEPPLRVL